MVGLILYYADVTAAQLFDIFLGYGDYRLRAKKQAAAGGGGGSGGSGGATAAAKK